MAAPSRCSAAVSEVARVDVAERGDAARRHGAAVDYVAAQLTAMCGLRGLLAACGFLEGVCDGGYYEVRHGFVAWRRRGTAEQDFQAADAGPSAKATPRLTWVWPRSMTSVRAAGSRRPRAAPISGRTSACRPRSTVTRWAPRRSTGARGRQQVVAEGSHDAASEPDLLDRGPVFQVGAPPLARRGADRAERERGDQVPQHAAEGCHDVGGSAVQSDLSASTVRAITSV